MRRPDARRRRAPRPVAAALAELAREPGAAPLQRMLRREVARAALGPWLARRVTRLEERDGAWTLACTDAHAAELLREGAADVLEAWRRQGLDARTLRVALEPRVLPPAVPAPASGRSARRGPEPLPPLAADVERALAGLDPPLVQAFRRLVAAAGRLGGRQPRD